MEPRKKHSAAGRVDTIDVKRSVPLFTLIAIPFFRRILPLEERRPGRADASGALPVAAGPASSFFLDCQREVEYYSDRSCR